MLPRLFLLPAYSTPSSFLLLPVQSLSHFIPQPKSQHSPPSPLCPSFCHELWYSLPLYFSVPLIKTGISYFPPPFLFLTFLITFFQFLIFHSSLFPYLHPSFSHKLLLLLFPSPHYLSLTPSLFHLFPTFLCYFASFAFLQSLFEIPCPFPGSPPHHFSSYLFPYHIPWCPPI